MRTYYITSLIFCVLSQFCVAQFAPSVGQIGTTAMHKDSSAFVAWSTHTTVKRGYQDISNVSLGFASAGDSSSVIGIAGTTGVVSLGDGGSAIVQFGKPIKNDPGFDFAIFENSFSDTFLELAFVEVSSDGVNYFRFPAISNTQDTIQVDGFGSVDPTRINNLAGKYRALYGTPFDLDELASQVGLDVNKITHIKIIDVVGSIQDAYATYDSNNNKINDPWKTPFPSSGFDLDAVGVIHQVITSTNEINEDIVNLSIYPNPIESTSVITFSLNQQSVITLTITDITGKILKVINCGGQQKGRNTYTIEMEEFNVGIYLLQVRTEQQVITRKILKQ